MRTRRAPAKVNLALDILGTRPDGYHDMKMVMQTISLCDTVTVEETAAAFELRTDGDFIPAGKKTLEQRAAEAFFAEIGQPAPGLEVTLEKRTPAYAGLGGGSPLLHQFGQHLGPAVFLLGTAPGGPGVVVRFHVSKNAGSQDGPSRRVIFW